MAGCGAYATDIAIDDAERLSRMAFRVNWKASFDFPYMGMFIPPVASDTEPWTDFNQQKTSIAAHAGLGPGVAADGILSAELLQRHRVRRRTRNFRRRPGKPPTTPICGKTRTTSCTA